MEQNSSTTSSTAIARPSKLPSLVGVPGERTTIRLWSNLPWCRPGKNWSVVRRLVGYRRFHTRRQVDLLNQLYGRYRLYVNFFLPVMKLQEKVRVGSHVKKVYDRPQTP